MHKEIQQRLKLFSDSEPEEFFASRKEIAAYVMGTAGPERKDTYWKHARFVLEALETKTVPHVGTLPSGVQYGKALSFLDNYTEFLEKQLTRNDHFRKSYYAALAAAVAQPKLLVISEDAHIVIDTSSSIDRLIVLIENGVTVNITESHEQATKSLGIIEYVIEKNAHLKHEVRSIIKGASRLTSRFFSLDVDASLTTFAHHTDGDVLRDEITISLSGSRASCKVLGAHHIGGSTQADTRIDITHASPHTTSLTMYRYVLDDKASGVFGGKINILPGADATVADMTTKAILLSSNASMYGEPQLEIYTDEVQCTHGASTGMLDDEALFYLQSRGMDKRSAQKELLHSFLAEPQLHI